MEEKFITLSIHTHQHALSLKTILEGHGIEVRLQKLVLSDSPIAIGLKVQINEKDIPLALKIVESAEHIDNLSFENVLSGKNGNILIPVDFNDYCMKACKAGFDLASRLNLQPVLLHAYPTPIFTPSFTIDDMTGQENDTSLDEEYNEIELTKDLQKQSRHKMKELVRQIQQEQQNGSIPEMEFKTLIEDGVAEDVIKNYCRMTPPALVVMLTRGKQKKGEQLIGSVTAEVLGDCKVPLFSIPENYNFTAINKVKELVFFCNMDQHDLIMVDTFMRIFEYPEVNITLIPLYDKPDKDLKTKLIHLRDYFAKMYPAATFTTAIFPQKTFMLDFNNFESQRGIEMIVVPNRRRNAIIRLLNPGIAQRLLFERDLPLLALPI